MLDPTTLLLQGVGQKLHPGAQLFVSLRAKTVIDFACGEARPGIPMREDSLVQWYSSGKPLTVVALAQLYESGEVLFDDKVTRYLPKFGVNGKEEITLWHLLTHTAGFRAADNVPRHVSWEEAIAFICEAPLETDWVAGEKAGYSTQAAWFVLAEIIQNITRSTYPEHLRRTLLEPLGMTNSWLSLPVERFHFYGERIAPMFDTSGGKLALAPLQDAQGMASCRPGASARGPISELARFYEMLLNDGVSENVQFLKPETISLLTTRHRTGLYDRTFGHTLDYGLGFLVNSNRYGAETVPYGYGRFASENTFGHSGAQSSCAFADRAHDLVVAWVANGMPGEGLHQRRQRELNNAIYESLGLAR